MPEDVLRQVGEIVSGEYGPSLDNCWIDGVVESGVLPGERRKRKSMIDLKKISRGRESLPPRVLIYGADGVGKTRMAVGAPDPFFLDLEKGSHKYDVARVVPESWTETLEWLSAIEDGKIKCKTVVIDSVTQLEFASHAEFFPGSSVDRWDGGYGKGDTRVVMEWRTLLGQLERLHRQGKAIVLIAQAVVKKFEDPTGPGYERFEVGVRPKLAGLLRQQAADYVFFCREEIIHASSKNERGKATTSGVRWAYTRRTPAYDAKARGTLLFPERFPLSWDEFTRAVASENERSEELNKSLLVMLEELGDESIAKQAKEFVRQNPENILAAHQSIQAKIEAKRAAAVVPVAQAAGAAVENGGS